MANRNTDRKLYAARDFKDAGTEKAFKAGDDVSSEDGIDNYVAAGLASEKKPDAVQQPADPTA